MRSAALAIAMILPSCAAAAPQPQIPVRGETPGYTCRGEGLDRFVGRAATPELTAQMRRLSGAKSVRLVRPGMMITMEYREDRLTVWVDAANRVARANCG